MPEQHQTDEPLSEELNFDNPDFQFVPEGCNWIQRGIYLICTSCELQHAIYIGTEKMFVGMKDGKPLFKDKTFIQATE